MTEITIAIIATQTNVVSITASKIQYLLKKPTRGGIPAIENKLNKKVKDNVGLIFDKSDN